MHGEQRRDVASVSKCVFFGGGDPRQLNVRVRVDWTAVSDGGRLRDALYLRWWQPGIFFLSFPDGWGMPSGCHLDD